MAAVVEYKPIRVTLLSDPVGKDLGDFSLHTFTLTDAFVLKNEAGMTVNQMIRGLDDREPASIRALVWYLKFKRGDAVNINALEFPLADFEWEVVENPTKARTGKGVAST